MEKKMGTRKNDRKEREREKEDEEKSASSFLIKINESRRSRTPERQRESITCGRFYVWRITCTCDSLVCYCKCNFMSGS